MTDTAKLQTYAADLAAKLSSVYPGIIAHGDHLAVPVYLPSGARSVRVTVESNVVFLLTCAEASVVAAAKANREDVPLSSWELSYDDEAEVLSSEAVDRWADMPRVFVQTMLGITALLWWHDAASAPKAAETLTEQALQLSRIAQDMADGPLKTAHHYISGGHGLGTDTLTRADRERLRSAAEIAVRSLDPRRVDEAEHAARIAVLDLKNYGRGSYPSPTKVADAAVNAFLHTLRHGRVS